VGEATPPVLHTRVEEVADYHSRMSLSSDHSEGRDRDPVCGMSVRVDVAVDDGLVAQHAGHTYHFCRAACRDAFVASPTQYVTSHAHGAEPAPGAAPVIDEGMRRWYESCSCCLSDAFPEVKAALDAERAAKAQPEVAPGICEVAEAAESAEAAVVSGADTPATRVGGSA
jgi:YHS domain-containing protein